MLRAFGRPGEATGKCRVIQDERPIFWEVKISTIGKKIFHMTIYLTLHI